MPKSIRNPNGWTIRKLIQNTYVNMPNRKEYAERDVLKRIEVRKITQYEVDKYNNHIPRTKYLIRSYSYPQYEPYYDGHDNRGRAIKYQRTYKHRYDIFLQMDSLSLDDNRIKLRTGSEYKPDFNKSTANGHWEGRGRNRHYIEGSNVRRGINLDFFYRLEWIYAEQGILYGRNWATYPPIKTNPKRIVFLDKHMWNALKVLINRGVIH